MPRESSAGIVPFRMDKGKRLYLLLLYEGNYWDFPKGKIESGETEQQAALRELKEETGISDARIIKGFSKRIEYFFRKGSRTIHKDVVFFIAETREKEIKVSHEHKDGGWFSYKEAIAKMKFRNAIETLEEAERFLEGKA